MSCASLEHRAACSTLRAEHFEKRAQGGIECPACLPTSLRAPPLVPRLRSAVLVHLHPAFDSKAERLAYSDEWIFAAPRSTYFYLNLRQLLIVVKPRVEQRPVIWISIYLIVIIYPESSDSTIHTRGQEED